MQCGILSTIPIPIPIVGLCPVGFWPVGFCPWDFVLWDFVRGILSVGFWTVGLCPNTVSEHPFFFLAVPLSFV